MTESCLEACMGIKRTCLDEFPPGHPKMFERMLDIISVSFGNFKHDQFISDFFVCLFCCCCCAVPYENVRKKKLFHADCPD